MGNLTHTVSGDIASFRSAARVPIESLKCHFLPKQDLHGYSKPWPAGGGKNLFNVNTPIELGGYDTNGTYIRSVNRIMTDYIPVEYNTTYTMKINNLTENLTFANYYFFNTNKEFLGARSENGNASFSGSTEYTFTTNLANTKYMRISIKHVTDSDLSKKTLENINLQVELGSSASAYEPYENICPIEGWNNLSVSCNNQTIPITFPAVGKNLINQSLLANQSGVTFEDGYYKAKRVNFFAGFSVTGTIIYKENTQYTISLIGKNESSSGNSQIRFKYTDGTESFASWADVEETSVTLTSDVNKTVKYIFFYASGGYNVVTCIKNLQVEEGTAATEYEPFNNIAYGGYVDIAKGELIQTHYKLIFDGTENVHSSYAESGDEIIRLMFWSFIDSKIKKALSISKQQISTCKFSHGPYERVKSTDPNPSCCKGYVSANNAGNTAIVLYLRKNDVYTSDIINDVKAYFKNQYDNGTPVEICYELAEPITYKLSFTQLQTLLDQNNIWSNTNDITEVSYAIHDSALIQTAKKQIIINEPHIETINDTIANFSTDMISPLKEAKVYFYPVQNGEGDPSPTNIREISGWTNINLAHTQKSIVPFLTNSFFSQGRYQSYTGWCDTWKVPDRTKQYIYSVYIDNTSGEQDARAIIWYRNKDNTSFIGADISNTIEMGSSGRVSITIDLTQSPNIYYIQFGLAIKNATASNPMVEIGNVNTEYESYNGSSLSLNWQNDIGTIYGGYVDLISGQLVQTYHKITLDGTTTNCKVNSDYSNDTYIIGGVVYLNPAGAEDYYSGYRSKLHCNITPIIGAGDNVLQTLPFIRSIGNGNQYLRIYAAYTADHPELDTTQKRKDYVNNYLIEHPMDIVYPLKTPVTYQLTPSQLKSFKGTNNILTEGNGSIEIKYWTH